MKLLLQEQLIEYQSKFDAIEAECIQLMKEGKDWKEKAKKGAGLKMMIDHVADELKKL